MTQTEAFYGFLRGVAERRSALLKDPATKKTIYPELGTIWNPTSAQVTMCDAFVLFFVAELEHYFEWIIEKSALSYKNIYSAYFLKHTAAGDKYLFNIANKLKEVSNNNNANWPKVSSHFEFIGMGKESHFPQGYWDDIDSIVRHRGHIAHKGAGIRISEDRREIFRKIELTIKRTRHFDTYFNGWLTLIDEERIRVDALSLEFRPPPFALA